MAKTSQNKAKKYSPLVFTHRFLQLIILFIFLPFSAFGIFNNHTILINNTTYTFIPIIIWCHECIP